MASSGEGDRDSSKLRVGGGGLECFSATFPQLVIPQQQNFTDFCGSFPPAVAQHKSFTLSEELSSGSKLAAGRHGGDPGDDKKIHRTEFTQSQVATVPRVAS